MGSPAAGDSDRNFGAAAVRLTRAVLGVRAYWRDTWRRKLWAQTSGASEVGGDGGRPSVEWHSEGREFTLIELPSSAPRPLNSSSRRESMSESTRESLPSREYDHGRLASHSVRSPSPTGLRCSPVSRHISSDAVTRCICEDDK